MAKKKQCKPKHETNRNEYEYMWNAVSIHWNQPLETNSHSNLFLRCPFFFHKNTTTWAKASNTCASERHVWVLCTISNVQTNMNSFFLRFVNENWANEKSRKWRREDKKKEAKNCCVGEAWNKMESAIIMNGKEKQQTEQWELFELFGLLYFFVLSRQTIYCTFVVWIYIYTRTSFWDWKFSVFWLFMETKFMWLFWEVK